jgi:hypothetical protein
VAFLPTGWGLCFDFLRNARCCGANQSMKNTTFFFSLLFLAGCAAPPPVKIASKLLGRTVLEQAKDGVSGPESAPKPPQE